MGATSRLMSCIMTVLPCHDESSRFQRLLRYSITVKALQPGRPSDSGSEKPRRGHDR